MIRPACIAAACLAALTGAMALPASAAVLYSTGFEAPTFSLGALNGQGGWVSTDPTATVENTVVYAGAQAVGAQGTYFTYYAYGPITPTAPITVSMAIDPSVAVSRFAVGDSPGSAGITAGVKQDQFGRLYAIAPGFPDIGAYTPGTWFDLSMTLDYATQTYSISLDGSQVASGLAFCGGNEHSLSCDQNNVTQFDVVEFNPLGPKHGNDYIDNVSIAEAPEPAAWALMIVGFAGVGGALRLRPGRSRRGSAGEVAAA